jgi:hypothetical protein
MNMLYEPSLSGTGIIFFRHQHLMCHFYTGWSADSQKFSSCVTVGKHFSKSRNLIHVITKKTPWSESASELYRPSDRRLSAKRLPTFVDIVCHVVSVTDPYGRILDFLDNSR